MHTKSCESRPGNLYTIHGSQGREWDTVIISVTDGGRKWFMSSKNPKSNGKTIVNTAVSRARRHVVLVLDYQYWQTCGDELISEIAKLKDNVINGNSL